jgi:hypothetical protein
MLWPWHYVMLIKKVSSERPVNGRAEQGNEALDLLASLREIDGAVSYGVFLRVSEPIHGVQASNCFYVSRTRPGEGRARGPRRRNGSSELRERGMLFRLIGRRNPCCFDSFDQLESASRTAGMQRDDCGVPDLQADLDGTDRGKGGDE